MKKLALVAAVSTLCAFSAAALAAPETYVIDTNHTAPVSYTHLDVYKRQR